MSEQTMEDTDPQGDHGDMKDLRRAAEEGKKAKQELAQMKRELAFTKAGITLDDPRMTYFVKGYDGDLDPVAIKSAATEAGFIAPDPAIQQQQYEQQQTLGAQSRVMAASAGAVAEDATVDAAFAKMEQAYAEGGLPAMFTVAQQYGVGMETNEL
jgi:hypothetical protein